MPEIQKKKSRRNFLTQVMFGWTALLSLPVFYAVFDYLIPRKLKERLIENYSLGKIIEVPVNSFKMFKVNKKPVIVIEDDKQIRAFSALCTHLGCVVEYISAEQKFHCNCHGSVFDKNGKNLSGPAPIPLKPFRVSLENDNILITEL